jgi:hypothetical protein
MSATSTSATVTATAQAEHSGFSPFDLPLEAESLDTFFVSDVGRGLDTGCTFRDQGPLVVTVRISRVVAEAADMNPDGTIRNWQELVNKGVLSRFAKLEMPAYDVDYNAPIGLYMPERDRITFNGQDLGPLGVEADLTGADSVWKLNTFRIPIEFVRFGRLNPNGGAPTPAENTVQIDIDQANIPFGENVWCTALDWVAIGFDAVSPVIMVHGNNSNGAFFSNLGFVNPFRAAKIPFDNSINMATSDIRTSSPSRWRPPPAPRSSKNRTRPCRSTRATPASFSSAPARPTGSWSSPPTRSRAAATSSTWSRRTTAPSSRC